MLHIKINIVASLYTNAECQQIWKAKTKETFPLVHLAPPTQLSNQQLFDLNHDEELDGNTGVRFRSKRRLAPNYTF